MQATRYHLADEECLDATGLVQLQRQKLAALLHEVTESNSFYRHKLGGRRVDASQAVLADLPFTTRAELEEDQAANPPFGTNLTYPIERYCRFHQTSGTGGRPLRWLDTPESWAWFARCWGIIFSAAGARSGDRVLFPFSFGPFVGFWAAFDGASRMGMLCLPAGGMTTSARLRMLIDNNVNVVCCTPTYALRMAEVARSEGVDLPKSRVRALIVAGEPGGNIPATREKIEREWGARVFDHSGMTEIGAATFECEEAPGGIHVIESEYIAEVFDPASGLAVADGAVGELVLTNLGRWGSPLIRYRTGDQVRLMRGRCPCGRCYGRLEGGILGRVDDMLVIRGNNVFPTAVEAVLRRFTEISEFRLIVREAGALTQVAIQIEPTVDAEPDAGALARRVGQAVKESLNFRAEVRVVPAGSLPRFEMKAKRVVRERT